MWHWLDHHIEEQAKYYGLSIEAKAELFDAAAKYDDLILSGKAEE